MTVELRAGHILTVTADRDSAGTVVRRAQSGDATNYDVTEIAASSSSVVGPFADNRHYLITSDSGTLTHAITLADATATSAGLSGALSDETGTGAAVFAIRPTITDAIITPAVTTVSEDGEITIASGIVKITKSASEAALTLATTATDGVEIQFLSTTAKAHVITASIDDGVTGGTKTTATFAAFAGASIKLISAGSKWIVAASNNVTVA